MESQLRRKSLNQSLAEFREILKSGTIWTISPNALLWESDSALLEFLKRTLGEHDLFEVQIGPSFVGLGGIINRRQDAAYGFLWIAPEFRGQKLAAPISGLFYAKSRELGIKKIYLQIKRGNFASIANARKSATELSTPDPFLVDHWHPEAELYFRVDI